MVCSFGRKRIFEVLPIPPCFAVADLYKEIAKGYAPLSLGVFLKFPSQTFLNTQFLSTLNESIHIYINLHLSRIDPLQKDVLAVSFNI